MNTRNMNRRNFLQYLGISPWLTIPLLKPWQNSIASVTERIEKAAIISAERGILPAFEEGISWAGGMSSLIFKKSRVLVKAAMAWDRKPGTGGNSDPQMISRIIDLCYKAGAREVSVFDQTYDEWTTCYKNSGIERAAKDASARVHPANDIRYYRPYTDPNSHSGTPMLVHHAAMNADIIINAAVTGMRSDGIITAGIDNLTGCIWNRRNLTDKQLKLLIGPLLNLCKPQLNITEVWLQETLGKDIDEPPVPGHLVISPDTVDADQAAAILLNRKPGDIRGVTEAISAGHGEFLLPGNHIRYLS